MLLGGGGGGGTPYNSLYREALPKRGTFFRLQVYELGAVISLFEVYKKVKGNQLTDAFYGCEKGEKSFWFCDLFILKLR